jgi:TonB-linked SusC/RagA family outer membrane protein
MKHFVESKCSAGGKPLPKEHLRIKIRSSVTKIMRITLALLLFFNIGVNATTVGQMVTLKIKNGSLSEVLAEIRKQTTFNFIYDKNRVDPSMLLTVDANKQEMKAILPKILKPLNLDFLVRGKNITIFQALKESSVQIQDSIKISGTVRDSQGMMQGASVRVKGSNRLATKSDMNGRYKLVVPSGAILVFNYIGYLPQEVPIGKSREINVELKNDTGNLNEVVVLGYGTSKRKDLVGSVASVSGETLKDIPVTSIADAMVGRMPGVQVTRTDGDPEADIKIRIRGGGSITQDNSPLFLVDGFPVDDINDIAPVDIVSIDVLKDASSTAIYGARGANGVVIVTTRGGREGAGQIRYNMYYGQKQITKYYDVLDAYEYVAWQYTRLGGGGIAGTGGEAFVARFGDARDMGLYKQIKGTNWQEAIFGNAGNSFSNNLSFSGGSKGTKYNISLLRNNENEILMGSGYVRTNLTMKTNHQINKWLTLDLNTRLSDRTNKGTGTSTNWNQAVQYRPISGLSDFLDLEDLEETGTDEDGESQFNVNLRDPVKAFEDTYRRRKSLTLNVNGALNVKLPVEGLSYRFEFGKQYSQSTYNQFNGLNTGAARSLGSQPTASIQKTEGDGYRIANILTYAKKDFLPGSNLTVMAGQELNYAKSKGITSSVRYLPKYIDAESALNMMQLGTQQPIFTVDNPEVTIASFFGRINYDYKSRYLLSMSLRADGSSKFAPGNQWGYFPAAGVAWRLSDEGFMKPFRKYVDDLKLRASYGSSGNNRISDNAWRKTFSVTSGTLFLDGSEEVYTPYLVPNSFLSNPGLKWESTLTRNLGLDFSIFNRRIEGSVEVYRNTTKDLLIRATIPSSTGYSTQFQNIGQTSNKGIEFSFTADVVRNKNLRLSASFNIGFNKYRIDKLGEAKNWIEDSGILASGGPMGDYYIEEGGSVGLMYGYELSGNGIYSFDDFTYDNGIYTLKPGVSDNQNLIGPSFFAPGVLKLVDQNGDNLVDNGDKTVIGNSNPKHFGGLNLTMQYKGFDMSMFFNWVYGNDVYNANKLRYTLSGQASTNAYGNIFNVMNSKDRFNYFDLEHPGVRVTDPIALAELNKNAKYWSPVHNRAVLTSWHVEDGSFLRLNNLTLGYTLPKSLLSKIKITSLRVYVTGYNLWIWTNYTGYDPEVDSMRATPLTPGIDYNAYPRARSYNVGLN